MNKILIVIALISSLNANESRHIDYNQISKEVKTECIKIVHDVGKGSREGLIYITAVSESTQKTTKISIGTDEAIKASCILALSRNQHRFSLEYSDAMFEVLNK